eukprot:gene30178-35162_t
MASAQDVLSSVVLTDYVLGDSDEDGMADMGGGEKGFFLYHMPMVDRYEYLPIGDSGGYEGRKQELGDDSGAIGRAQQKVLISLTGHQWACPEVGKIADVLPQAGPWSRPVAVEQVNGISEVVYL